MAWLETGITLGQTRFCKEFVLTYLNQLGLHEKWDADEYLDSLYQRHESTKVDSFLDILDARNEGGEEGFFDFKNQTLEWSLDVANYATDLYKQYLNWFISENASQVPKRILDIGCENGIVTCFYATLFPEAEVVGIDLSSNAITCAKELASKLKLRNVRFDCVDAMNLSESHGSEYFDMITSLCSIQEVVGYLPEQNDGWSDESFGRLSSLLNAIGMLLNSESRFIFCERFLSPDQIVHFAHVSREAGLTIDWMKSGSIQFHELEVKEQMPVFIAVKNQSIE